MAIALTILIVGILLGAVGQIALKTGVNLLGEKPPPLVVLKGILTPWILAGFACYFLSSILYLLALSRLELSYAYPMVAVSYVVVAFLSWRLLHEPVPALRVVGLAVICAGVLLVAVSYRPHSPEAHHLAAPPAIEGHLHAGGQS